MLFAACATVLASCSSGGPSTSRPATSTTTTVSPATSSSTTTTVPTTRAPAAANVLQEFVPVSATTWWAVLNSNVTPTSLLVRTSDSGRLWHDVSPPVDVGSAYFLSSDMAWVETGAVSPPPRVPIYRTVDGGASWQKLGSVPNTCDQLDFVDVHHGWCISIGGALGSSFVKLFRTTDGGYTWTLVSETGLPGVAPSTPDSLPFGCDKSITFTSPTVGWASSYCNGGSAFLYTTEDAGSRWYPLSTVPLPPGAPAPEGEGLGAPAVDWPDLAVALSIGGPPGATAIATSSDGGASWHAQLVPGPPKLWSVDLIDPTSWRLTDGTLLMATDDAGQHWRTWKPPVTMKGTLGTALTLRLLSRDLGWAIPDSNGGPL
jgi:photosystem II stability/assembly factor-like uncharacterized protein